MNPPVPCGESLLEEHGDTSPRLSVLLPGHCLLLRTPVSHFLYVFWQTFSEVVEKVKFPIFQLIKCYQDIFPKVHSGEL